MTDFEKMTVENEIGMRKEDNPELFNSVYRRLFGGEYVDDDTDSFKFLNDDEIDEDDFI